MRELSKVSPEFLPWYGMTMNGARGITVMALMVNNPINSLMSIPSLQIFWQISGVFGESSDGQGYQG